MPKIERILCPVDFSEFSVSAYQYAQSIASHYNAKLILQNVWLETLGSFDVLPVAYPDKECNKRAAEADQHLRRFAADHSRAKVDVQFVVQDGLVADLILAQAKTQAVDLIVIGTHGWRGLDRMVLGSVTERVLRRASCPVLAVRKPAHHAVTSGHDLVHLRKILICTDFSDYAQRALDYALSMAGAYGAELTLLHIIEDVPKSADFEDATDAAMKKLDGLIPPEARDRHIVKAAVRIGKPYQQIIQLAIEAQTDMVVMGVRGGGALDVALFGSATHRVIRLGSCPVLVVNI